MTPEELKLKATEDFPGCFFLIGKSGAFTDFEWGRAQNIFTIFSCNYRGVTLNGVRYSVMSNINYGQLCDFLWDAEKAAL